VEETTDSSKNNGGEKKARWAVCLPEKSNGEIGLRVTTPGGRSAVKRRVSTGCDSTPAGLVTKRGKAPGTHRDLEEKHQ